MIIKTKQQNKIPKLRFPGFSGKWKEKRLGEVADFWNGKAHEQNISQKGKYIVVNSKFISSGGKAKKYSNLQISPLKRGDITIVMSDVPNGRAIAKCFLIDQDNKYTLNQRIGGIRPDNIISQFLFRVLDRNKYFLKFDNGVSQTNLRKEEILRCPVCFPSLSEQQKIAGFLGAVDERIEVLKKKREALKKYKKGIMQKIFSQEIRFKNNNGKDFPEWEEERLGEVVQLSTASYVPVDMNLQEGYYLVDMGSVLASGKLLTKKRTKKADSILKKGDLVMPNRDIGRGDIIGKVAYIDDDNRYVLGSNMYKLSILYNIKLSSMFLFYLINNSEINRVMRRRANGTSQLQLVRKDIESVNILIPSFTEQQKIANFLSAIDKKIELVEAQIQKMQEWKRGLMQGLFV